MPKQILQPNTLSFSEKKVLMEDLFPREKVYVDNVGNYLSENFKRIDGFDYRWSSLITSKPLLFEDVDYVRVRDYVNNECTQKEIQAYKEGKLRQLYTTFETMLICNLKHYDRIMSFCTMIFLKYVRISELDISREFLNDIPYVFDMTPTQIWCCALTGIDSTEWELNYAWKTKKNVVKQYPTEDSNQSLLELNYKYVYGNKIFSKFVEYCSSRVGVSGFLDTYYNDKTSNKKLSQVCSKFTRTSTAIDDTQLQTISDYIYEDNRIVQKLFTSLNKSLFHTFLDPTRYAVYIFSNEFYIHTQKFKMRVSKSDTGVITKDYLANSYECFVAEMHLQDTIREQLDWSKYQLPVDFEYDKNILTSILLTMINESYKNIKCIKRMSDSIYTEITFSGTFMSVYIHEKFYFNKEVVHTTIKCFGKPNAAKYIINRGYYIFGTIHDIDVMFARDFTKETLIKHYSNYCIPVEQHMSGVIMLHVTNNNDIIDVLTAGTINPQRINNKNAKYTMIKGNSLNQKDVMNTMKKLANTIVDNKINKPKLLTYYRAVND